MKKTIKTLSVLVTIVMLTMVFLPSANATGVVLSDNKAPIIPDVIGNGSKKYEKEFIEISELNSPYSELGTSYFYHPLYEYYNDKNTTNSLADYVLIFAGKESSAPLPINDSFGNHIVFSSGFYYPYELGYWIYLPKENKVLTLREAYDMRIEGIENVFNDYSLGTHMGDLDKDGKLTIKDATYVQKCLANIIKFPSEDKFFCISDKTPRYLSDFNRDGVRNVKDATAIQKYIAGFTE